MHGAGNDFIIINNIVEKLPVEKLPGLAKKLCAPHTSIGADGLMAVMPGKDGSDYSMLFYNSDGSLGEMCGNGARCICRYGFEKGLAGEVQRVSTTAGLVVGQRISGRRYRIRLNDPGVLGEHTVPVDGCEYLCSYVELGSPGIPHAIVHMDDWDSRDMDALRSLGRTLRFAPCFPKGANVTFAKLTDTDHIKAVTFERGVEDFTLACGTGAGSTVTVFALGGLVSGRDVKVDMPGGTLEISVELTGTPHDIFLTGPTNIVCEGEITDEDLEG